LEEWAGDHAAQSPEDAHPLLAQWVDVVLARYQNILRAAGVSSEEAARKLNFGISLFDVSYPGSLGLIALLRKRYPQCRIYAGGPTVNGDHVLAKKEMLENMRDMAPNAVIYGEADQSLPAAVSVLDGLAGNTGLAAEQWEQISLALDGQQGIALKFGERIVELRYDEPGILSEAQLDRVPLDQTIASQYPGAYYTPDRGCFRKCFFCQCGSRGKLFFPVRMPSADKIMDDLRAIAHSVGSYRDELIEMFKAGQMINLFAAPLPWMLKGYLYKLAVALADSHDDFRDVPENVMEDIAHFSHEMAHDWQLLLTAIAQYKNRSAGDRFDVLSYITSLLVPFGLRRYASIIATEDNSFLMRRPIAKKVMGALRARPLRNAVFSHCEAHLRDFGEFSSDVAEDARKFDHELADLVSEAFENGGVTVGLENGSTKVLLRWGKGFTFEQARNRLINLVRSGVKVGVNLIHTSLESAPAELAESLKNIALLILDAPEIEISYSAAHMMPLRGSAAGKRFDPQLHPGERVSGWGARYLAKPITFVEYPLDPVVRAVVANNIDALSSLAKNDPRQVAYICVQMIVYLYIAARQAGHEDSRQIERIFTDLQGELGQRGITIQFGSGQTNAAVLGGRMKANGNRDGHSDFRIQRKLVVIDVHDEKGIGRPIKELKSMGLEFDQEIILTAFGVGTGIVFRKVEGQIFVPSVGGEIHADVLRTIFKADPTDMILTGRYLYSCLRTAARDLFGWQSKVSGSARMIRYHLLASLIQSGAGKNTAEIFSRSAFGSMEIFFREAREKGLSIRFFLNREDSAGREGETPNAEIYLWTQGPRFVRFLQGNQTNAAVLSSSAENFAEEWGRQAHETLKRISDESRNPKNGSFISWLKIFLRVTDRSDKAVIQEQERIEEARAVLPDEPRRPARVGSVVHVSSSHQQDPNLDVWRAYFEGKLAMADADRMGKTSEDYLKEFAGQLNDQTNEVWQRFRRSLEENPNSYDRVWAKVLEYAAMLRSEKQAQDLGPVRVEPGPLSAFPFGNQDVLRPISPLRLDQTPVPDLPAFPLMPGSFLLFISVLVYPGRRRASTEICEFLVVHFGLSAHQLRPALGIGADGAEATIFSRFGGPILRLALIYKFVLQCFFF